MPVFKRKFLAVGQTSTIVISIEKTISDPELFIYVLNILKKRFGIKLALAFSAPELLFFNKRILHAVAAGKIDKTVITDNTEYFWADYIEFSKRQETDNIFLCSQESITNNWISILKFIVSLIGAVFTIEKSKEIPLVAIKKMELRGITSPLTPSFDKTVESLFLKDESLQSYAPRNTPPQSLFISKRGVERFGGIDQFLSSVINIAGATPSQYKRIWQIDNDLSFNDFLKKDINLLVKRKNITIPGMLLNSNEEQVLLDINPGLLIANQQKETEEKFFNIPRNLLCITHTRDLKIVHADREAVFIMSNFNKAPYIAGALYGVVMQTHKNCSVHIIDDISTDNSAEVIEAFIALIDSSEIKIHYKKNEKSKGTYWIRNSVIHESSNASNFYFVNDSDDISSCQRAKIQLSIMDGRFTDAEICFGDIIRVDKDFRVLPLDGKVERYGTASLSAPISVHKKYGFYENIKKNADTEFIERLRHYSGKQATKWFRYPILFQPFDGKNLTSDIYSGVADGVISENLNGRIKHKELFTKIHKKNSFTDLTRIYTYPEYSYSSEYFTILKEFII